MPISDKELAQIRRKQQEFLDALLKVTQLWTRDLDVEGALKAGEQLGLEAILVSEFLAYWIGMGEIRPKHMELVDQINARIKAGDLHKAMPAANRETANSSSDVSTTYDLFISHASEDKDTIARPLYEALRARDISVWFDEAELTLGDSLRRKIDEGLARCRFGVVILSPKFLEKQWPQRELDALVARETATGKKALLPILHDLDATTLLQFSPTLADRFAATSSKGIQALVMQIERALSQR